VLQIGKVCHQPNHGHNVLLVIWKVLLINHFPHETVIVSIVDVNYLLYRHILLHMLIKLKNMIFINLFNFCTFINAELFPGVNLHRNKMLTIACKWLLLANMFCFVFLEPYLLCVI
jgi:hypothetical protein